MSSAVYYKFKSQKKSLRATFDGTGISVFDLKREILLANKLEATAETFELRLTNPDTGEVYGDDSEVIPRSSSVEARRVPASRPGGRDSAAKYLSGNLVVNGKNASRREDIKRAVAETAPVHPAAASTAPSGTDEEAMMAAMFAAQGEQWQRTQEEMAVKAPVYNSRGWQSAPVDKELPPGYICHRCGQKGHWINQCPTLNDPNWEVKRVRRTTGIPKSMLKTVDKPLDSDGGSYMMNADGQYVVAVADDRSWQDFQKRTQQFEARSKRDIPDELKDPLTGDLMVDPARMPCCQKVFSDASIQTALINSEFKCPSCGKEDVFIDQLVPDEPTIRKLRRFNAGEPLDSPGDERTSDGAEGTKDQSGSTQSGGGGNSDGSSGGSRSASGPSEFDSPGSSGRDRGSYSSPVSSRGSSRSSSRGRSRSRSSSRSKSPSRSPSPSPGPGNAASSMLGVPPMPAMPGMPAMSGMPAMPGFPVPGMPPFFPFMMPPFVPGPQAVPTPPAALSLRSGSNSTRSSIGSNSASDSDSESSRSDSDSQARGSWRGRKRPRRDSGDRDRARRRPRGTRRSNGNKNTRA